MAFSAVNVRWLSSAKHVFLILLQGSWDSVSKLQVTELSLTTEELPVKAPGSLTMGALVQGPRTATLRGEAQVLRFRGRCPGRPPPATGGHWTLGCRAAGPDMCCQDQMPSRALRFPSKVSNEIHFTRFRFLLLVCLQTKVENSEVQVWPTLFCDRSGPGLKPGPQLALPLRT